MSTILTEEVYPSVELTFTDFNYSVLFEEGLTPLSPAILVDDVFTHTNDYLVVNLDISNQGYYDRFVEIAAINTEFEYRVIYDDTNISLDQLMSDMISVPRLTSTAVTLLVENIGVYQYESLEFNIAFNRSLSAPISFDITPEPLISEDVFGDEIVFDAPLTLPATLTQIIAIDLSAYENFLLFDNKWSLNCSHSSEMIVTVVHLNQECATTTIIFDYDDDAEQFSSLAIAIDIGDDFLGELATLELILVPVVAGSTSTISHSFVIEIQIEIVQQEPEYD